jgi:hypothetical protein
MSLLAKTGTFAKPTVTGTQVITGLGFQPKALIFYTFGAEVNAAFTDGAYSSTGLVGDPPPGFNQRYASTASRNLHATAWSTASVHIGHFDKPIAFISNTAATDIASTATFDADGFTLDWTTISARQIQINYLAIGGEGIQAHMRTGSVWPLDIGESRTIEGFGFRPQVIISIPAADSGLGVNNVGTGFTSYGISVFGSPAPLATLRQWNVEGIQVGVAGERNSATTMVDNFVQGFGRGVRAEITNDGFIVRNYLNQPIYGDGRQAFLAIGGDFISEVRSVPRSAVAGAHVQNIPLNFKPAAILQASGHLLGTPESAPETPVQGPINYDVARVMMGTADSALNNAAASVASDDSNPSKVESYNANNRFFVRFNNNTRTITSQAYVSALTASNLELTYTANDTTSHTLQMLLLGSIIPLRGRAAGISRSTVSELKRHIALQGKAQGTTRATAWLGPAHILDPERVTGTSNAELQLRGAATIAGKSTGTSSARAILPLTATLSGKAEGTSRATAANLRRDVLLDGQVTASSEAAANLGTGVGFRPARLVGYSDANAYLILQLPPILPTPPHHAPGTINLHRNPSVEKDLLDWYELEDGEIERTTAEQRHGNASVKVTIPAAATGSGFYTAGAKGLALAAQEWSIYGQMMMLGAGVTGIKAYLRGYYSDGTTVDGDSVDLELSNQWEHYPIPAFVTDPDKIFIGADIVVERTDSGGELVFYVDMVQIEEGQLSSFAYGGFGPPYYSWNGPADASITARQPIPYVVGSVGEGGGVITIEGRIYRATYDNDILEDLTDHLIDATVSMDAERDYTWVFDGTMTRRGWDRLRPAHDWLAPFMRVTYPNGIVREGQLGLYMVYDSPSEFTEWSEVVDIQAFDALWLLDRQAFPGSVIAPINYNKVHFARQILEGAVLTEDKNGPRRFSIPSDPDTFKGNREWDRETTRLEVVNDCLKSAGLHPLWSTRTGVLTSKPRGQKRLLNQNPVRMWHANVPEGMVLADNVRFNPNIPSEIIGTVVTEPKSLDMVNETLIISDAPEGMRALAKKRIANIRNKRDRLNRKDEERRDLTPAQRRQRRRRRIRRIGIPYLDDDAKAAQVARALLDKWSTKDEVVTFSAVPDPSREFTNECIYLGIWNGYGQEVAVGKYLVHKVSYGFTPKDGEMKVVAGRVQNSEDIYED